MKKTIRYGKMFHIIIVLMIVIGYYLWTIYDAYSILLAMTVLVFIELIYIINTIRLCIIFKSIVNRIKYNNIYDFYMKDNTIKFKVRIGACLHNYCISLFTDNITCRVTRQYDNKEIYNCLCKNPFVLIYIKKMIKSINQNVYTKKSKSL